MDERIIAYFLGELTKSERIKLLVEVQANSELGKEMASYQNMLALSMFAPEARNVESGLKSYLRLMQMRRKRKMIRLLKTFPRYVAAIAVLIAATWLVVDSFRQPANQLVVSQQELFVPAGQRARITLPDGTIAWINAGSTLSYPSAFYKERRVKLTGEGYFNVAKQPDKPFIVSTEQLDIKALGTQFDVCSYPQTAQVSATLIEGSIKVYKSDNEGAGTILHPNEQLIYENGEYKIEQIIDADQLLWKQGIYSFKKQKLAYILKHLELYCDVKIVVTDPLILQYQYTGKFRQSDGVHEILRIIQKIHHFKIDYNEETNRITLHK